MQLKGTTSLRTKQAMISGTEAGSCLEAGVIRVTLIDSLLQFCNTHIAAALWLSQVLSVPLRKPQRLL
jgi:hypothetical protein